MALDPADSIEHVVLAVPARNEAATVGRCLHGLLRSAQRLDSEPARPVVTIAVACDSCSDDTIAIVDRCAVDQWPSEVSSVGGGSVGVHAVTGSWLSAGGARRAAVDHGLGLLPPGTRLERVWIATTDADSYVADDWLARQLAYAAEGFDAIAGIVELIEPTLRAARAFRRIYSLVPGRDHPHVHGANLGVRADAYVAAGGFPALTVSEDHALWNRLRRDGRRCLSPLDVTVRTSPRPAGRAVGGFADTLAAAMTDEQVG